MAVALSDLTIPAAREPKIVIDVRTLAPTNRNARVFDAFDRLDVGAVLEINGEAEPRSLRNEFLQFRTGRFSWDARNLGSARWTIRLERIDERADLVDFLSHCPPFLRANRSTIAELVLSTGERQYARGETIFDEAEAWPYLAFVRSGRVVYTLLSSDGKSHSLGERLTFDALNDSGTFDGGGATTRAETLTKVTIALISAAAVLRAVRTDSEVAVGFLAVAAQAQRRSIETIADLAFARVLQRVAKFLMSYATATTGMAPGCPTSSMLLKRRSLPLPAPSATWRPGRCFA